MPPKAIPTPQHVSEIRSYMSAKFTKMANSDYYLVAGEVTSLSVFMVNINILRSRLECLDEIILLLALSDSQANSLCKQAQAKLVEASLLLEQQNVEEHLSMTIALGNQATHEGVFLADQSLTLYLAEARARMQNRGWRHKLAACRLSISNLIWRR